MYNSLLFFVKDAFETELEVIFTKSEFKKIQNKFSWEIGPEDFYVPTPDSLDKRDVGTLQLLQPDLFKAIDFSKYDIQFAVFNYYTSSNSEFEFTQAQKIPKPNPFGANLQIPKAGRPRWVDPRTGINYDWYSDEAVFKKSDTSARKEVVDYLSNCDRVRSIKSEFFKIADEQIMEDISSLSDFSKKYVRLINVYSKKTEALKFKVVNAEFFSSRLNTLIEPFNWDDPFFFGSYKIDEFIAAHICQTCKTINLEFDFTNYEYYLEVCSAKDFFYYYDDFVQNLTNSR
ncbi:DUF7683 domain-containing protein [Flavobacterium aurantiibacter]|uniref:DUF7683 domain-containing protein n=1 Tax=Flavobacterium aurantiibacter TaxID=2023067 RepID=A0A256A8K8_9FLAO|nr:hypothetical protein [Flavobacterium aurantiibacter]OYQ50036.1 hypothetical protein CHX27_01010 [Flavobacterium aurantiibacter]